MDRYEDVCLLGRGAYALVRLVRRKADGALLVVKRFNMPLDELEPKARLEVRAVPCRRAALLLGAPSAAGASPLPSATLPPLPCRSRRR